MIGDDTAPLPAAMGYRRIQSQLFHRPRQQRSGVGLHLFRDGARKATAAKLLTRDEARRIASNIAKLPSYCVAGTNLTLTDKSIMIRLVLLALILTTPAHAERWCNGTLTSNNVCESNVPPVIVRCDYYDNSNSDPRCLGVGDRRPSVERRTTKSTSRR